MIDTKDRLRLSNEGDNIADEIDDEDTGATCDTIYGGDIGDDVDVNGIDDCTRMRTT